MLVIENALAERKEVTVLGKKQSEPVHTLSQLLDSNYLLERPRKQTLMEMAGQPNSGFKVWPKKESQGDDNVDSSPG